jgi:hypothetical protein
MPNIKQHERSTIFDQLLNKHSDSLSTCQELIKPLSAVLESDGICKLPIDNTIFTRLETGLIFHTPVPLRENLTKKDLGGQIQTVGVFINTMPLIDPISRRQLEPGAFVIRLRPFLQRGFAFDFIDENNNNMFSVLASPTEPGGYEALPDEPTSLPLKVGGFNVSVGQKVCVDTISGGTHGPHCYRDLCVSFLKWKACWVITTAGLKILG